MHDRTICSFREHYPRRESRVSNRRGSGSAITRAVNDSPRTCTARTRAKLLNYSTHATKLYGIVSTVVSDASVAPLQEDALHLSAIIFAAVSPGS